MKPKLLIIHLTQFGYHNNAYMYCKYLKDSYNITYLCYNTHRKRILLDGIKVIYVDAIPEQQNIFASVWRNVGFFTTAFLQLVKNPDRTIIFYYKGCGKLRRIFKNKWMLLDIRTLSVSSNPKLNEQNDAFLKKEAELFNEVSFLSEGMRDKIKLQHPLSHIIPLGSEVISTSVKKYYPLELLYVGTVTNRHLEITLQGLKMFIDKYGDQNIRYHIVGNGNVPEDLELLKSEANELGVSHITTFYGRIPNSELRPFFDMCNIGVSFVPMTDYFDNQPVTKTYEYSMSGLYVIGTATSENCKAINKENGLLINDSPSDFCKALTSILNGHNYIKEAEIRNSLIDYEWRNIIEKKLKTILE